MFGMNEGDGGHELVVLGASHCCCCVCVCVCVAMRRVPSPSTGPPTHPPCSLQPHSQASIENRS